MGTYSSERNEYQDPVIPATFDTGRNLRKAFMRGWLRGIWHDGEVYDRYTRPNMQRAYESGHAVARAARRERGEQIP